ncbi:hypothetical protein GCM10023196_012070 [Actinoallomurus vinaceus]|uniref:Tn3 transposase DDE domain-containing protein n=1 Tax=Actinoallomurus vinaceus TaxID=1080074 RepID=A0ABP8U555_9ACTN
MDVDSDKLVASWRARAMASHPSDFAANPEPVRLALLAALAWCRTAEITDALVDLLIGLVSKVNTRAERKVEQAMYAEAKKVHGKPAKRTTRHLFVNRDNLRAAIAALVNSTLKLRNPAWWGTGTACASDAKKFGSWSSNLMTEYHVRYGGHGVMIDWHVERKSVCVYSQLKSCSVSEVSVMIEGVLRHCTERRSTGSTPTRTARTWSGSRSRTCWGSSCCPA